MRPRRPPHRLLTPEEYRAFEDASPVRHEFVGGRVYAMSGVRRPHSRISGNIFARLWAAAQDGPCRVHHSEVKLRVGDDYYYPDVMVACGPEPDDDQIEDAPCLVVEVLSPSERAAVLEADAGHVARAGRAGFLLQDPGRYLVAETALEEAALAVGGDGMLALAALERVGLAWAAGRHPRDLSSGERERLGLAAVAVAEPDLLVLDEPTRGVDPVRKAEIARWLERYAAAGRAVLVVTHDRTFPAHRRVSLGEEVRVAV